MIYVFQLRKFAIVKKKKSLLKGSENQHIHQLHTFAFNAA